MGFRTKKSAISDIAIKNVLKERYNILAIYEIRILPGGKLNSYCIDSSEGMFVLKEFPLRFAKTDLRLEPEINDFLRSRGIPAAKFCRTTNQEYIWEYHDHIFHLREYINGEKYPRHNSPEWLMRDSALLLGLIHKELAGFSTLKKGDKIWQSARWNTKVGEQEYLDLMKKAEGIPSEEIRRKVLSDLQYRIELLPRIAQLNFKIDKLTNMNCHGDYKASQLICGQDSINAVIDFSNARSLPVAWEIIRSYAYSDPVCINGEISAENLKRYIRAYLTNGNLNQYDLKMMPYLFYFHMVLSNHTFKQFLFNEFVNKKSVLKSASWRTDICRWLEKNVEALSEELSAMGSL